MKYSRHALKRSQQRSLPIPLIEFIYQYGEFVDLKGDRMAHTLQRKQGSVLISELKRLINFIEKAQRKIIIASSTDPTVITVINRD